MISCINREQLSPSLQVGLPLEKHLLPSPPRAARPWVCTEQTAAGGVTKQRVSPKRLRAPQPNSGGLEALHGELRGQLSGAPREPSEHHRRQRFVLRSEPRLRGRPGLLFPSPVGRWLRSLPLCSEPTCRRDAAGRAEPNIPALLLEVAAAQSPSGSSRRCPSRSSFAQALLIGVEIPSLFLPRICSPLSLHSPPPQTPGPIPCGCRWNSAIDTPNPLCPR